MRTKLFLYSLIIVVSLSIIAGSSYYLMGGMDEVIVYELPGEQKIIVGQEFTGRYTDKTIADQFYSARRLVLDSAIRGTLVQVVYENDTLADNEVSYFTGVEIIGTMAEVPLGYTVRKIQAESKFAVFLSMHPLVRPSPEKIEAMLASKADSLGMSLAPFIVEKHYPDNSMSVEGIVVR
jgi:hypothetical protein